MRIAGLPNPEIRPVTMPALAGETARPATGGAFKEILGEAIGGVQAAQTQAHATLDRFLNGEGEEIHQVALDAQRASLQFEFFLQMRNKVVQAYQEIMRQQL